MGGPADQPAESEGGGSAVNTEQGLTIKEQLANPQNYGEKRTADQIRYLVIHYTGNDGDTAANNAAYYQRTVVQASAHYFVDDTTIYRSVPELCTAWAVGGKKYADAEETGGGTMYEIVRNANSISVELCDTVRDGTYQATEATLKNAFALCRALMEKYHIPMENVYRHFDVTGKHCPAYYVDPQKWAEFKRRLEVWKVMDNDPSPAYKEGVEWALKEGILLGNEEGDLMLRQGLTREQFCAMLKRWNDQVERRAAT